MRKSEAGEMTQQLAPAQSIEAFLQTMHLLNQLCWNLACMALSEFFPSSYIFLKLSNEFAFWTGEKKRHNCSEYLLSTYNMLSSVIGRTGKMERKRHGLWQKGTHNLVLVLEWSKAIFSCLYCWDLCRAFSFFISVLV